MHRRGGRRVGSLPHLALWLVALTLLCSSVGTLPALSSSPALPARPQGTGPGAPGPRTSSPPGSLAGVGAPRSTGTPTLHRMNMPWLCVYSCGISLAGSLSELRAMAPNLSAVSYTQFEVDGSGGFQSLGADQIVSTAQALGLETFPLIQTADCGDDAETLVENNHLWWPFISAALSALNASGYSGYNVDFEPNCSPMSAPANFTAQFAHFMDLFSNASHAQGAQVSMDIAWYGPTTGTSWWDPAYLSATTVDTFWSMNYGTYASFLAVLSQDLSSYPRGRLGEGLAGGTGDTSLCPSVGVGGYANRIHDLEADGVTGTAFWAMDDGCWDYPASVGGLLHDFLYNASVGPDWALSMGSAPQSLSFCTGGWSAAGSTPVTNCTAPGSDPENATLSLSNGTGVANSFVFSGWELAERTWSEPLQSLQLSAWEYLDNASVHTWLENLSCSGGTVLSQEPLPESFAWSRWQLTLNYSVGGVCGIALGLGAVGDAPAGFNNWFMNVGLVATSAALQASLQSGESSGYSGNSTVVSVEVGFLSGPVEWASVNFTVSPSGAFAPSGGVTGATGWFNSTLSFPDVAGRTVLTLRAAVHSLLRGWTNATAVVVATPRPLVLAWTLSAMTVSSGGSLPVSVEASAWGAPVAGVALSFSDGTGGGSFLPASGSSSSSGSLASTFDAPVVSGSTWINLTAAGSLPMYNSTSAAVPLEVLAGASELSVALTAGSSMVAGGSEGVAITVEEPGALPAQGAVVILTVLPTSDGDVQPSTVVLPSNGSARELLEGHAPAGTDLTVGAEATLAGFRSGFVNATVAVLAPPVLSVTLQPSASSIAAGGRVELTAMASEGPSGDTTPVPGVRLAFSSDGNVGSFATTVGATGPSGSFTVNFTAPVAVPSTGSNVVLWLNATFPQGPTILASAELHVVPLNASTSSSQGALSTLELVTLVGVVAVIGVALLAARWASRKRGQEAPSAGGTAREAGPLSSTDPASPGSSATHVFPEEDRPDLPLLPDPPR